MKGTKSALLTSAISLLLSFSMLIGATFAWFTDTVKSGVNKIVAGNLDVEVEYALPGENGVLGAFQPMTTDTTSLFSSGLWEPGHTEYVTLRVVNKGTLALKYQMNVSPVSESGGINRDGQSFKLSDYMYFGTTAASADVTQYATRAEARDAIAANRYQPLTQANLSSMSQAGELVPNGSQYITLVVYMPETVGNVANYKTGTNAPYIDLGITVVATQKDHEVDSFNNEYDKTVNFDAVDTVVVYNYFPQVSYIAQLKMSNNPDKATKDDPNNANISETENTITIQSEAEVTTDKPYAKVTFKNTDVASYNENNKAAVELNAKKTDEGNFTVEEGGVTVEKETVTYEVTVKPIIGTMKADTIYTVDLFVGEGKQNVKVTHKGATPTADVEMKTVGDEGYVAGAADTFTYNPTTGYATLQVSHFSEFEAVFDAPIAAIGTEAFYSLQTAAEKAKATETEAAKTVTLIRDVEEETITQNINLNLNGNTIEKLTVNNSVSANIDDGASGGKIEELIVGINGTVVVPDGAVENVNENSQGAIAYTGGDTEPETTDYFAAIGDKSFKTLEDAVTFAGASDTIVLLRDIASATISKDVTVTANGQSLTAAVASGKKLTITGGTFNALTVTGDGTCAVTGGTFYTDPTSYVASGCLATPNAETNPTYWTVAPKPVDNTEVKISKSGEDDTYMSLADFRDSVNGTGKYTTPNTYADYTATLQKDIDLAGEEWTPIGYYYEYYSYDYSTWTSTTISKVYAPFCGTFDGAEHTISNLSLTDPSWLGEVTAGNDNYEDFYLGLFGVTKGGEIKNLTIKDSTLVANGYDPNGFLVAQADGTGLTNCHLINCDYTGRGMGGLLADYLYYGTASGCTVDATSSITITGGSYASGIAAYGYMATITDCVNNAPITGTKCAAGIVGNCNQTTVTNCTNTGAIHSTGASDNDSFVGGIAGTISSGSVSWCVNTANVSTDGSNSPASGIVAQNCSGNVSNVTFCYNTGDISGAYASGIAAGLYGSTPIDYCYNAGAISGAKGACGISQPVYGGTCNSSHCVSAGTINKGTTYLSTNTNTGCYYYSGGTLKTAAGADADADVANALTALNTGLETAFWGNDNGVIKPLSLIATN